MGVSAAARSPTCARRARRTTHVEAVDSGAICSSRLHRPLIRGGLMVTRETPWPDGTPCWVDLMTGDAAAAREFYGALFGWDIEVGGAETGFYGMCSVGGRRVVGIGQMQMEHPPVWTAYLATSDVDALTRAITEAGGSVVLEPIDVFDFGRMAVAQDPTGGT